MGWLAAAAQKSAEDNFRVEASWSHGNFLLVPAEESSRLGHAQERVVAGGSALNREVQLLARFCSGRDRGGREQFHWLERGESGGGGGAQRATSARCPALTLAGGRRPLVVCLPMTSWRGV